MEKLELKYLAGYLPYGLKILRPDGNTILQVQGLLGKLYIFQEDNKGETFGAIKGNNKPILRLLSDLTKEIEHNREKFVPSNSLVKNRIIEYENGSFWYLKTESLVNDKKGWLGAEKQLELFQKLLEWHFDIYGLIEKDLAIDINTLK